MKTKLQDLRKEAGFKSAKAFASLMDMPVGTYTDYEQGRRHFALEQAWAFADALGAAMGRFVSLDELAGRKVPPAESPPADGHEAELVRTWRGLDDERRIRLLGTAHDMEIAKSSGSPSAAAERRGA